MRSKFLEKGGKKTERSTRAVHVLWGLARRWLHRYIVITRRFGQDDRLCQGERVGMLTRWHGNWAVSTPSRSHPPPRKFINAVTTWFLLCWVITLSSRKFANYSILRNSNIYKSHLSIKKLSARNDENNEQAGRPSYLQWCTKVISITVKKNQ